MRIFAALFFFLFPGVGLTATPPAFDVQKWNRLVEQVAFVGENMVLGDYVYKTYSNIRPSDKTQPHQADYFSTVGFFDSFHKYNPMFISAVSENWSKDDKGNWLIDQWIWQLDLAGNLQSVFHGALIETPDGSVLDMINRNAGSPESAEELGRWGSKLSEWLSFQPFSRR